MRGGTALQISNRYELDERVLLHMALFTSSGSSRGGMRSSLACLYVWKETRRSRRKRWRHGLQNEKKTTATATYPDSRTTPKRPRKPHHRTNSSTVGTGDRRKSSVRMTNVPAANLSHRTTGRCTHWGDRGVPCSAFPPRVRCTSPPSATRTVS